jgi:hypothetical protein
VADATILTDNSRSLAEAFTVCRVQTGRKIVYDIRETGTPPLAITNWLDVICPDLKQSP